MNKRILMLCAVLLFLAVNAAAQTHSNTLTWTWTQGTGDAADGYHVKRATTPGGPYTTVATTTVLTKTFVDVSVAAGQTNYYVVTAYNAAGDSLPSSEVRCDTPFQAPAAPTNLQGTAK